MGSGFWSATDYHTRANIRESTGRDVFDYSNKKLSSGVVEVHQTLNPFGMSLRESRDSLEHPDSNSIIISLDVTGSMGRVVRGIHGDLPHLHELLLGHKFIPHPQILFAAVGDATSDRAPLQVGQFESDNRMDQNIENMIIEGGGGAQTTESYELMLYVAARHTAIDCFDKRQRKGYLFIIGDEMAYPAVKKREVDRLIGGGLQTDVPLEDLIAEVQQRYRVYFVIPGGASHGTDKQILRFWHQYLGEQNVLHLDNPAESSECIAVTIGVNEGVLTPESAGKHLESRGVLGRTVGRLKDALHAIFPAGGTVSPDRNRRL